MSQLIDQRTREKIISEITKSDGQFTLVCETHNWSYGSKRPPHFDCKKCQMVSFVGLLCNTPPDKREEVVGMLEYSVHKLIEAENHGELNRMKLYKHPQVTIEKDATN